MADSISFSFSSDEVPTAKITSEELLKRVQAELSELQFLPDNILQTDLRPDQLLMILQLTSLASNPLYQEAILFLQILSFALLFSPAPAQQKYKRMIPPAFYVGYTVQYCSAKAPSFQHYPPQLEQLSSSGTWKTGLLLSWWMKNDGNGMFSVKGSDFNSVIMCTVEDLTPPSCLFNIMNSGQDPYKELRKSLCLALR